MKKNILMILLLYPVMTQASFEREIGEKETTVVAFPSVDEIFPQRLSYYSEEEFLDGFRPLIAKELWSDFEGGWRAIYQGHEDSLRSAKPTGRLSIEKETAHIRCLYESLSVLEPTDESFFEIQKLTIYSRFTNRTHRKLISTQNPVLEARMAEFMNLD